MARSNDLASRARPRIRRVAALLATALALVSAATSRAQFEPLDPCVRCELIYSGDGSGRFYEINPADGTSRLLGTTTTFFDIAATVDGRLFGVTGGGAVHLISACDAAVGPSLGTVGSAANGLAGDLRDPVLFAQGPPLSEVDLSAGFSSRVIGGSSGTDPPFWCGGSSGDLALNPVDGLLYSALSCAECAGDMLVTIDPATGMVLEEVGCLVDSTGAPLTATFGLAFDSCGDFWAGTSGSSDLVRVDARTAVGERVPITGGYSGTYGLASIPCLAVGGTCDPCAVQVGGGGAARPAPVGPALHATGHGPVGGASVVADFEWAGDLGAPRAEGDHYHLWRGRRPEALQPVGADHPMTAVTWTDATAPARSKPACVYLRVVAVDACELEELR